MISSRDQPIRVIICDDAPEMRLILHDFLSEDPTLRVLAEADNGRDCVRLVGELQPDVVLLDLSMPHMDGLEAIPKIIEVAPQTAVVVFSGLGLSHMATAALAAGADRYIEKGTSLDELAVAFREVAQSGSRPAGAGGASSMRAQSSSAARSELSEGSQQ